jgi:hypothetical protein
MEWSTGRSWVSGAVLLLLIVSLFASWHQTGFLHSIGVEPRTPSTTYNFWSGFGSDVEPMIRDTLILGLLWYHTTCHAKGCWRIGKYRVEGTPYKVCRKCHPTVPDAGPTRADIHQAHRDAQ